MNTDSIDSLEKLILRVGEGWMFEWHKPREKATEYLKTLLERVDERAKQLFPQGGPRFTEEKLIAAYERSPHKVHAFVQALGESNSPDMLIMVWRVLQGMEIAGVEMHYLLSDQFSLQVSLRSPYGEPNETYQSQDIDDAALVRHFGIMKMGGRPVFDGFYATKARTADAVR